MFSHAVSILAGEALTVASALVPYYVCMLPENSSEIDFYKV